MIRRMTLNALALAMLATTAFAQPWRSILVANERGPSNGASVNVLDPNPPAGAISAYVTTADPDFQEADGLVQAPGSPTVFATNFGQNFNGLRGSVWEITQSPPGPITLRSNPQTQPISGACGIALDPSSTPGNTILYVSSFSQPEQSPPSVTGGTVIYRVAITNRVLPGVLANRGVAETGSRVHRARMPGRAC